MTPPRHPANNKCGITLQQHLGPKPAPLQDSGSKPFNQQVCLIDQIQDFALPCPCAEHSPRRAAQFVTDLWYKSLTPDTQFPAEVQRLRREVSADIAAAALEVSAARRSLRGRVADWSLWWVDREGAAQASDDAAGLAVPAGRAGQHPQAREAALAPRKQQVVLEEVQAGQVPRRVVREDILRVGPVQRALPFREAHEFEFLGPPEIGRAHV